MSDAIFVPDGDLLIPQPSAAGPWFPGVQHGGAICGVFARSIEAVPTDRPMFVTRMSVDMTRKVPMGPARVETDLVREGRRVQAIECRYVVEDDVVARATATRIRIDDTVFSEPDGGLSADPAVFEDPPESHPPGRPDDFAEADFIRTDQIDFVHNFTMRREERADRRAVTWLRLERPFVAGEEATALQRVAMCADMIPSAGSHVDYETHVSVNPDLTINLHRLPEGDWVGHVAVVHVSPDGFGRTDAELYDQTGTLGRSIKSLLIDPR